MSAQMKSKRSNAWLKHHGTVVRQESKAKQELEEASGDFEAQVKRVAVISLVSGVALVAGYGLYKALTNSDTKKVDSPPKRVKEVPEKVKVQKSFSWKTLIFERIAMVAVKFIGAQLALLLSSKLGLDEDERSKR